LRLNLLKNMRKKTFLVTVCAVAALFAEETVRTPVNNEDVRVLDVVVQPHEKTKMHEHKANRVMLYRVAGAQNFEYSDGRHAVLKFRENEVKWSPMEGMHIAEVATAKPVNIVEIELKKPGAGKKITTSLDPLKVDPKHYKLELENDQVRVFRVRFGPHESAPLHEHQLTRITVYLTDAKVQVTYADGKVELIPRKAGDIAQGGPSTHKEQNTTDQPVELLVTELKY
jgi:quercetin dioxygenase-like cupin family protein